MEKRVQILELELLYNHEDPLTYCRYPDKLLDMSINKGSSAVEEFMRYCWENLCCDSPNLHSCGFRNGFKSLKVLRLLLFVVTDEDLETLLSKCSVLERLSVEVAKGLVNLRVVGQSITLKHLVVEDCYDLKMIEICDTNIVSFVYDSGHMPNLLLNNVPFLIEVSIRKVDFFTDSIRLPLNQLSCRLSQLETLQMAIRKCSEIGKTEKLVDCLHHSLKAVEIQGYRAHPCADEHVIYLLKNAVALEKIVIDPVRSWLWSSGSLRPTKQVEVEVKGRDHAMQHLKEKVPSTIEFVCLK